QDAHDAVEAAVRIALPIDPEEALAVLRPLAVLAAELVGVRGAQLALQLPEQVGELRAGGDAVDQRQVAAVDRVPVEPGHVLCPEVLTLEAPGFAEHLAPFGVRADRDLDPLEVDPAALAARTVRDAVRWLLAGLQH